MTSADDDAERRRRALYRPGADAEEVRRYLEVRPPVAVRPALAAPVEPAAAPAVVAAEPIRARRQVLAVVLALLVLLVLPAATSGARLTPLPLPRAGEFTGSQRVTLSPEARSAALAGRIRLWAAIRATAPWAARDGTEAFSGSAAGSVRRGIDPVPIAASRRHVVTIFILCEGGSAGIGLGSEAEDFGGTSSFSLNDTTVPCDGVRMVRYRPPAGLIPTSVDIEVEGGRRAAYSVVGGF